MDLTPQTRALYVPSDPPRDGVFACWCDGAGPLTAVDFVRRFVTKHCEGWNSGAGRWDSPP